jgi:hypothetical protein
MEKFYIDNYVPLPYNCCNVTFKYAHINKESVFNE